MLRRIIVNWRPKTIWHLRCKEGGDTGPFEGTILSLFPLSKQMPKMENLLYLRLEFSLNVTDWNSVELSRHYEPQSPPCMGTVPEDGDIRGII